MPRYTKQEKAEAIETLRRMYPKGSTVYTVLRSVSRSGMSRTISLVALLPDGSRVIDFHPNYSAAAALGYTLVSKDGHDGLKVGGCGMDMGFSVVYDLAHALYGDGCALSHRWL